MTDPTGTTTTSKKSGRIERGSEIRAVPCPHCKSTARHTDRIGCCSGCKVLFTSMTAFDHHRRVTYCLDPQEVGLVQKAIKSDPSVPAWGLPAGDMTWPVTSTDLSSLSGGEAPTADGG